jgi:hypothetical protein
VKEALRLIDTACQSLGLVQAGHHNREFHWTLGRNGKRNIGPRFSRGGNHIAPGYIAVPKHFATDPSETG